MGTSNRSPGAAKRARGNDNGYSVDGMCASLGIGSGRCFLIVMPLLSGINNRCCWDRGLSSIANACTFFVASAIILV